MGAGRVLGVDCGAIARPARTVGTLVAGLAGADPDPAALRIRLDHVGAGYAVLTKAALAAMTLAARTEGLILDPIYTGRALAGLTSAIAEGQIKPGERTVLLHSGGLPGLFGHVDAVARSVAALAEFS
jgi:L-cysteate sulfo-lyase